MKKGFPNKILGIPIGWRNLGEVTTQSKIENGRDIYTWKTHLYCGRRLNVGKEGNEIFRYCERCLLKIKDK